MVLYIDQNFRVNNYRLLDVLLYNTGIYLDEYTAWKVILDQPWICFNVIDFVDTSMYKEGSANMLWLFSFYVFINVQYLCLPPSGGDILFLPCPSVRLSVCPSVTLRFRSITQVPFDPEPSNFIGW